MADDSPIEDVVPKLVVCIRGSIPPSHFVCVKALPQKSSVLFPMKTGTKVSVEDIEQWEAQGCLKLPPNPQS
jgi:hypothetical protein